MTESNTAGDPGRLTEQLRRLVLAVEASGRAILPSSGGELLQSIVEAAARLFGAAAASLALVDEPQESLVFRVAVGAGRDDVVGMRIPLDRGIAGYVAMTGQPIAISSVRDDPRFNAEFAKSTGYVPRSILATPLISHDRVIGVMEVLDKINAPSFGMQDMELLGMFARQAALAIDQSQQIDRLNESLVRGLKGLADPKTRDEAVELWRALGSKADEDSGQGQAVLALADLFNTISRLGEAELKACLQVMSAFAEYTRSKPGG